MRAGQKGFKQGRCTLLITIGQRFFQISSSSGDRKCTHLSKVVKSCLSIPNGNANVERSLSDNKKTLASEHTNLKKETLMGLRRAKVFQAFARVCGAAHIVNMQIKG